MCTSYWDCQLGDVGWQEQQGLAYWDLYRSLSPVLLSILTGHHIIDFGIATSVVGFWSATPMAQDAVPKPQSKTRRSLFIGANTSLSSNTRLRTLCMISSRSTSSYQHFSMIEIVRIESYLVCRRIVDIVLDCVLLVQASVVFERG